MKKNSKLTYKEIYQSLVKHKGNWQAVATEFGFKHAQQALDRFNDSSSQPRGAKGGWMNNWTAWVMIRNEYLMQPSPDVARVDHKKWCCFKGASICTCGLLGRISRDFHNSMAYHNSINVPEGYTTKDIAKNMYWNYEDDLTGHLWSLVICEDSHHKVQRLRKLNAQAGEVCWE